MSTEPSTGGVPVRVCRHCSTQSQTSGEFCPHCGGRFSKRRGLGRLGLRTRRARFAALACASVAAVVVAVLLATGTFGSNGECQKLYRDAQQYAQQFTSGLPGPVSQSQIDQLTQSGYQAEAASHNVQCR